MDKRFMLTLAALFVVIVGIFWFTKAKDNPSTNGSNNSTSQGQPTEHTQGAGNKGVTLLEYGDFQCPACGQYYPIVKQVKQKYGDDIKFQFRHFPLIQIHPNAMQASRAAEAASKQNKFWEMHDMLYEQQQTWTNAGSVSDIFVSFAQQLGLNVDQFKNDMASETVDGAINADMKAGQAIGANSTPTFVINGKKVEENPRDVEGFSKLIDQAIADAQKKQ